MKAKPTKKFMIPVSLEEVKIIDGKVYVHIYIGDRNKWLSYNDASNMDKVVNK